MTEIVCMPCGDEPAPAVFVRRARGDGRSGCLCADRGREAAALLAPAATGRLCVKAGFHGVAAGVQMVFERQPGRRDSTAGVANSRPTTARA